MDEVEQLAIDRAKELFGCTYANVQPHSGCPFHTRCPKACDICSKEIPQLKEIEKGHFVACHLYQ